MTAFWSYRRRIAELERELWLERSLSEARKDSRDALRRDEARREQAESVEGHYTRQGYLDWLNRHERPEGWDFDAICRAKSGIVRVSPGRFKRVQRSG